MKLRKSLWLVVVTLATSAWLIESQAQNTDIDRAPLSRPITIVLPKESNLVATLETVKPGPMLRLTVENRGMAAVRVLRLRPGWFEYNAGSLHDWQISIEGPGGHYQFPFFTGTVALPGERDYIDLAPGEAFSTPIRISEASRYDGGKQYPLPQAKGTYTATVSHGALRSNTLTFAIGDN